MTGAESIEATLPDAGLATTYGRLRLVTVADTALVGEASRDTDVVRFTDITSDMDHGTALAWIGRRLDGWVRGWRVPLVIEAGDDAVGYMNLRIDRGRSVGEIGYWLLATSRGRGVMRDAVRAISSWAFDALHLGRVQATVQPANHASLRTLERAGFIREGLLRSSDVLKGQRFDHVMLSLLPTDPRT